MSEEWINKWLSESTKTWFFFNPNFFLIFKQNCHKNEYETNKNLIKIGIKIYYKLFTVFLVILMLIKIVLESCDGIPIIYWLSLFCFSMELLMACLWRFSRLQFHGQHLKSLGSQQVREPGLQVRKAWPNTVLTSYILYVYPCMCVCGVCMFVMRVCVCMFVMCMCVCGVIVVCVCVCMCAVVCVCVCGVCMWGVWGMCVCVVYVWCVV